MKRKWLTVAVAAAVIIGALIVLAQKKPAQNNETAKAPGTHLAMTAEEIGAAINYGKNHKDDLLIDFEKPWTVFLGYENKGGAIIYTPYHYLALMARNEARSNLATDTENLYQLCAGSRKNYYFEVTLYGTENGFDADYKPVILKDGREMPVLKDIQIEYDQAREYTISSRRDIYFSEDVLKDKGKITLRIIRPKTTPLDFEFDLGKIR